MRSKTLLTLMLISPIPTLLLSLTIGQYPIPPHEVFKIFILKLVKDFLSIIGLNNNFHATWPKTYEVIIFNVRLPRLILAIIVGSTLSVCGAALQSIFRNPLVEPYILGISSGAAFGAALAIAFLEWWFVQPLAFLFGLTSIFLAYTIAKIRGELPIVSLILAGIIITAMFTALTSIIKFIVEPHKLAAIIYWIMGSLALASWRDVLWILPSISISLTLLVLMRWRLNVLTLSDEEAKALGVNIHRERLMVIILTTLATSSVVSVSGIIGWVGLLVPHIVRMVVGPDNRLVIPISLIFGGTFLLIVDDLARTLTTFELPLSTLTTICGAPLFIYLLRKTGVKVWKA